MSNYQSDPNATKEIKSIWEEHLRTRGLSGDAYIAAQQQLRLRLKEAIGNLHLLTCLSGKWLLRLGHMQNCHRPVEPHVFHMRMSMAVEHAEGALAT